MFTFTNGSHLYTLASNNKNMKEGLYTSRQQAKEDMYKYIDKNGLQIVDKEDSKHYKTYICNDGTYFYINRV